jgi:YafQ family addiction module toxin component
MREIRHTNPGLSAITGGKNLDGTAKCWIPHLMEIVTLLAADTPLPSRNFDHPLSGEWSDYRDCHVKPDLILLYRKPDNEHLDLIRLGSHSELGF